MAKYRSFPDLSTELLRNILDFIDPEKDVGIDKRAYLSQESFSEPPSPSHDQVVNVGKFRLICQRSAAVGASHQFARVTTRFSSKGFARLEAIAEQPHLAKHVKKFSYMVPYFYTEGRENVQLLVPYIQQQTLGTIDVELFRRKINDQQRIVRDQEDGRVLKKAIAAFTALQHVQILPVQDYQDQTLISFIRHHEDMSRFVELKWAPACLHSAKTIGNALLASKSPFSRFSSPMLSPQSAIILAEHPSDSFSMLAERLTCLELHFDDGPDLEVRMSELSDLFKTVFMAAINMEEIHVGFPMSKPIGLPLETIFHNVRWSKLIAFGVQGWKLHADEIIGFVARHRDRLKGLRLRSVLLREGSMWKDVLAFLQEMPRLDWVSLRYIDYSSHADELRENAGIEILDDPPGDPSDSEDEDEDLYWADADDEDEDSYGADTDQPPMNGVTSDSGSENISDYDAEESDDEHGPAAYEMDFPPLNSPDTPNSWCNCNRRTYPLSVEDLGDDGISVDLRTWKMWEKWVLGRCPEHDPR